MTAPASPTIVSAPGKVLIAGGGVAGMILAMFLKQKGYAPIIFERNDSLSGMGLGLW